jgi:hypothetical protein
VSGDFFFFGGKQQARKIFTNPGLTAFGNHIVNFSCTIIISK